MLHIILIFASPNICFLVRTYEKQQHRLLGFLTSIYATQYPNYTIILANTESAGLNTSSISSLTSSLGISSRVIFSPFDANDATNIRKKYSITENDYGYLLTDLTLEWLKQNSICDYLIVTNGDNWYSSNLFDVVVPFIHQGYHAIAFHFVSHHVWPSAVQSWRAGTDVEIRTKFEQGWIDLGAGLVDFDLLKQHNIDFAMSTVTAGKPTNWFGLDGEYWLKILEKGAVNAIIPRVLFVHQ
jgi:hypothetical protein